MTPQPIHPHASFARLDAREQEHTIRVSSLNDDCGIYWYVPNHQPVHSSFARLETTRSDRKQVLIGKVEKEIELHPEKLGGTDIRLFIGRVHLLASALLQLKSTYVSMGLTEDESLYGRVHLATGKGTLHIELLLGEDMEDEPDTFATLYRAETQQWSLAGEFRQVLIDLKNRLGIMPTC